MKYVILDNEFIDLKAFDVRIDKLFIEVDGQSLVKREIGVDKTANVVHKYPSSVHSFDRYGILDFNVVTFLSYENELSKLEFENIWKSEYKE